MFECRRVVLFINSGCFITTENSFLNSKLKHYTSIVDDYFVRIVLFMNITESEKLTDIFFYIYV